MFWRKKEEPEREPIMPPDNWVQPPPPQPEPEPEPAISEQEWQGKVVLFKDDGTIAVRTNSIEEAKLAIKQLKLRKKAIALEKREVNQEIAAINADRRQQTAQQGSMTRGRGQLARTIRTFESISRDTAKRNHAARLQPYQQEKARLDNHTLTIDRLITDLEVYIHQHEV